MALLTCRDLCLGYEGKEILKDLNFEVNSGDYLCIVGENGSGKSTLMKTILGLQSPLSGEITTGDSLLQREIGYLPQQTVIQRDFPATVWEIVLSGCQGRKFEPVSDGKTLDRVISHCQSKLGIQPFYTSEAKSLAAQNIERMGITDLTKRCYRELSGGQQQRVLLARALCATRRLLLLDEPVSGLDPKVTAEMYSLIKKLNDDGITIIMISHDIEAALEYASHILHIGKTVFCGTKQRYLNSDEGFGIAAKGGESR